MKGFGKYGYSWFIVFCLAAIAGILLCNAWLLCCGKCVINDFLRVPPIGWGIMLANLLAGAVLFAVRRRKKGVTDQNCCNCCSTALRESWSYCPCCGAERPVVS